MTRKRKIIPVVIY